MKIVKYRKIYYLISGLLILASITTLAVNGLKLGIDFTGGSLWEVRFPDGAPEQKAVEEKLGPLVTSLSVQQGDDNTFLLRFQDIPEDKHQEAKTVLGELGTVEELRFESIGPVIGEELKRKGIIAVGLGVLAVMFYIAYVFRRASRPVASWQYGLITAMVALFHDVFIPLGVFSLLGRLVGFEVSIPFIAALLTVLGFSVHDTIVVFDRVRENVRRFAGEPFEDIVERSLRQTFFRSINTSLTLLFAVAAVWYFGGSMIRPFALTVMVGVALGTYSSIFVASTSLITVERWFAKRRRIR